MSAEMYTNRAQEIKPLNADAYWQNSNNVRFLFPGK